MSFYPGPFIVDSHGHLTRNTRPNSVLPAGRFEELMSVVHQYQHDAAAAADADEWFHRDVLAVIRANPGMRAEEAEAKVRSQQQRGV